MRGILGLLGLLILGQAQNSFQNPRPDSEVAGADTELSAEGRAISYLAYEVPAWSRDNHCFSCHNNGDGARALYTAQQLSYPVPAQALTDTSEWLAQPLEWDNNRGDPGFSDKQLARIQFAASLVEAFEAGLIEKREILIQAAESLLPFQKADGSWQVDIEALVGSPATYGTPLGTYMARRTLEKADASRFEAAIARADEWFLQAPVNSMLDASSVMLALQDRPDSRSGTKVRQCLELILDGQASDGGWGPYRLSPSEPFDTAVVLLALLSVKDRPEIEEFIQQGRAYLIRRQLSSGGWPETTRPPGSQSYAQHLSTSGWATLALLLTGNSGEDLKR